MFINKTTEEVVMRPTMAIFDWDGCIQDIAIPWYRNALLNKDIFNNYLNLNDDYTIEQTKDMLFNRTEYELIKGILKKGITIEHIPQNVLEDFNKLCTDDPEFYFKAPLLTGYRLATSLLSQDLTRNVIFLTHYQNEDDSKKKLNRFNRIFKSSYKNVRFVGLPLSIPKSKWINDHCPEWNLIVEDAPHVLLDIIENCDCVNKTIIYPTYGYNRSFEATYVNKIADAEVEIATYIPKLSGLFI